MIPNPFPNSKFFVFEGPDGCGKTVQLEMTENWLRSITPAGHPLPVKTKEPNRYGLYGKRIYAELNKPGGLHETDPFNFQRWYACDSKVNLRERVIPYLAGGYTVLCDRFRPSLCYGAKDYSEFPALMQMNCEIIGEDFIWPNLILIFDVAPETSISRSKQKGRQLDEHERLPVQIKVRDNYLHFANMYPNCYLVNGEPAAEEVFASVKRILSPILQFKPNP